MLNSPLLGGEARKSNRGVAALCCVMTAAACIMYIVALSTPALINTQGIGNLDTSKLRADFGPFRVCYHLDTESDCEDIDKHCEFQVDVLGTPQDVAVVDDCSAFNAVRVFLVLATLFAAAGLIAGLAVLCSGSTNGLVHAFCFGLNLASAICGVIAMGILVKLKDKDDAFTSASSADWGYGFWLLTVAWVLSLVSALPYCIGRK